MVFSIIKHQLLDIRIVIRRGIVYSASIAAVTILYLLAVFVLEKAAQAAFGYRSMAVSLAAAFALGIAFIPLRHKIQQLLDTHFFHGDPMAIAQENELLHREVAQAEKHKAVATLASGMAHEIKNPLTAIRTFCEYLPQKLDDKAFLRQFSALVGKEVGRIDSIVEDLIDFARPAPLKFEKADVNRLIANTLNFLDSQFIRHRITVIQNLATHPHPLDIDPNKIKQAFLNIFLNAIESMPDGGTLRVLTTMNHSQLTMTIQDTGVGIAPEDLRRIFDPFFSKKDGGTGLGLAVTQGIIKEHGGKISVKSEAGKGTVVIIEMQATQAPSQRAPEAPGRVLGQTGCRNIS